MRVAVLTLLAVVCIAVPATQANTTSERTPSLVFKLVNMNGKRQVLSRHAFVPYTYSLSPDHKRLAYIPEPCINCPVTTAVMVADVRGPHDRVLVDAGRFSYGVSWAPNGRQIDLDANGLWFVNPDGSVFHESMLAGVPSGVWSPNSRFIVSNRPISVFSLATRNESYLAQGYAPSWSPNGSQIVYAHNSDVEVVCSEVGACGRVPGVRYRLTRGTYPSWSPDGSRIAFRRWSYASLWIMPSQGGKPRRVGRGLDRFAPYIWSPKGRQIAFVSGQSLWVTRVNGRYGRFLAREYGEVRPLAWSRDGRHILYFVLRR